MSGVTKVRKGDDDVYEAVGAAAIVGGALVVPSTTAATNGGLQGIDTAGAKAANCLGVAARRAVPVALQNYSNLTDADGYDMVEVSPVNELTTVYKHAVVPVVYTAAAVAFGAKLVTAAGGKVQAFTSGVDDASLVVGECRVVGGMGSGGGVGLAYIY